MPTKNPRRVTAQKASDARSRTLHEAGFTNLQEAAACANAVTSDLEEGRIDATEANRINAAVSHWRRAHIRRGGR